MQDPTRFGRHFYLVWTSTHWVEERRPDHEYRLQTPSLKWTAVNPQGMKIKIHVWAVTISCLKLITTGACEKEFWNKRVARQRQIRPWSVCFFRVAKTFVLVVHNTTTQLGNCFFLNTKLHVQSVASVSFNHNRCDVSDSRNLHVRRLQVK